MRQYTLKKLSSFFSIVFVTYAICIHNNLYLLIVFLQTDADRRFLAAKGSVPVGIGKNSHIKRAIIDKNARIGDNVKVGLYFIY